MELRQEPSWSVPQTARKPWGLQRNEHGWRVQEAKARGHRGGMGSSDSVEHRGNFAFESERGKSLENCEQR